MPLKVVFAQDLSGSFSDDIANVRTIVPEIISEIRSYDAAAELAITSFIDKPISPFGSPSDYAYNTDIALTSNAELLASLTIVFQPEVALMAMKPSSRRCFRSH